MVTEKSEAPPRCLSSDWISDVPRRCFQENGPQDHARGWICITSPFGNCWSLSTEPEIFAGPSSTDFEVRLRYGAVEEVTFAVSYRKIRLKRFDKIQKALLQREHNWLRPWASLHVKTGDKSEKFSSRGKVEGHVHSTTLAADDRDDESDQGLASKTAERGRSKSPSPPSMFQRSMPGLFESLPGSADTFPSQASETSPTPGSGYHQCQTNVLPLRPTGVENPGFL